MSDNTPLSPADYALAQQRQAYAERTAASAPGVPRPAAARSANPREKPITRMMSEVEALPVDWLWPERFARGMLSILIGDPDIGKSFVALDMAARVSTGSPWPDNPARGNEPGGVVLLSAEDDPERTIKPRLEAMGADCSRIALLEATGIIMPDGETRERPFTLADVPILEKTIQRVPDCKLVVIDPVSAYMAGADSHNNTDVRGMLAPVARLAMRYGVAVVCVSHLRKGGGKALYRLMGSLAFVAAARTCWAVARDPGSEHDPRDRRRLFLRVKNNLSAAHSGLAFEVVPDGMGRARVVWERSPVNTTADEALNRPDEGSKGHTPRDDAAEWLEEFLADGPKPVKEVEAESKAAGLTWATVRRAKSTVGVSSWRETFGGGWTWGLADQRRQAEADDPGCSDGSEDGEPDAQDAHQGAHIPESEHLGEKPDEFAGIHPKALTSTQVSALVSALDEGELPGCPDDGELPGAPDDGDLGAFCSDLPEGVES